MHPDFNKPAKKLGYGYVMWSLTYVSSYFSCPFASSIHSPVVSTACVRAVSSFTTDTKSLHCALRENMAAGLLVEHFPTRPQRNLIFFLRLVPRIGLQENFLQHPR